MSVVISHFNQKGGIGKTTSAVNVGSCLARHGYRVLIVDADGQGNATAAVGLGRDEDEGPHFVDALVGEVAAVDAVKPTRQENLSIICANNQVWKAELHIVQQRREDFYNALRDMLTPLAASYDFVFVDCPPSIGVITLNVVAASDAIVIPVQPEYFSLDGIRRVGKLLEDIESSLGIGTCMLGFLMTKCDLRKSQTKKYIADMRTTYGEKVFSVVVRENVRISEAQAHGQSIFEYDPLAVGADDYAAVTKELLERLRAADADIPEPTALMTKRKKRAARSLRPEVLQ